MAGRRIAGVGSTQGVVRSIAGDHGLRIYDATVGVTAQGPVAEVAVFLIRAVAVDLTSALVLPASTCAGRADITAGADVPIITQGPVGGVG